MLKSKHNLPFGDLGDYYLATNLSEAMIDKNATEFSTPSLNPYNFQLPSDIPINLFQSLFGLVALVALIMICGVMTSGHGPMHIRFRKIQCPF